MRTVRPILTAIVTTLACVQASWAQDGPNVDQAFLEMAGQELGKGTARPIDHSYGGAVQPVDHAVGDPAAETYQQFREQFPTPSPGYGQSGVSNYNLSTDPASSTTGIRLDTAFGIMRGIETANYLSEHQTSMLVGVTILPIQTPCWVLGLRTMGGYSDNMSMTSDGGAYSIDAFWGTRYKKLYHKIGGFIDDYDQWKKAGVAYSALTEFPILGTVTLDAAFGFHTQSDEIFLDDRNPQTLQARRVEQADVDYQIRVGKFWCECFQSGLTGNYYPYNFHRDEYGAGVFSALYLGRFSITGDVTGGNEGLRGFIKLGIAWGANPSQRNRDCRVSNVDNVAWVTRPTERDQSTRLRETYSGPIPVGP